MPSDEISATLASIFTNNCLNFVVVKDIQSVSIEFVKRKLVIFVYQLNLIWYVMGANLLSLEEIHILDFLVNLEIPYTKDWFSQAMNWLVSFYLIEWVQVKK